MENVHGVVVLLHPVAALTIVDSHEHKKETQPRVIGTVLGGREKGVVEVRAAYPVPHNETDEEVAIDMQYEQHMSRLHQTVNPADVVLGWYATSPDITEHSVLIHDYYSKRESQSTVVYLTFDTKMRNSRLQIKAYIRCQVGVPKKSSGVIFSPIPVEIVHFEPERVGVELLKKTIPESSGETTMVSDLTRIEETIAQLLGCIERLMGYVQDVIDGKVQASSSVGRMLMDAVAQVPQLDSSKFEQIMNSTMQDLLMVVYLVSLAKTQLTLGEKLSLVAM